MQTEVLETRLNGQVYEQFGHRVLYTQLRFRLFDTFFDVDEEVQRQVDPVHRGDIKRFILNCLEKGQAFYFGPLIFSARGELEAHNDYFILKNGKKLYINDGQHRYFAMLYAINDLRLQLQLAEEYGKKQEIERIKQQIELLQSYPLTIQIYLDLDKKQEKQLFTDLNTQRKHVSISTQLQYDQRNEYNILARTIAKQLQQDMEIDLKAIRVTNQASAMTSLPTMKKCLIALFEGVTGRKSGDPYYRCNHNQIQPISQYFFKKWLTFFPKNYMDRSQYVVGYSGIQIALALTVHYLDVQHKIGYRQAIDLLPLLNKQCTWRHDDKMFSHIFDEDKGQITRHSSTTAINRTMMQFLRAINKEMGKGS